MANLLIDRALETAYIAHGIQADGGDVRDRLRAADVGLDDFALISTPEITLLASSHVVDPDFGVLTSEAGAIAMRTPVRPDEIEDAVILLYDTGSAAELLARATIWPFYGIRATSWLSEPDGSSAITIVDGIAALEPIQAGYSEDLVRAWYILTEQPVVTHLLAIPAEASDEPVEEVRARLTAAASTGYAARREVRRNLQADSSIEGDALVDFLARIRYELDGPARTAAFSLIARGSGGTRYPLIPGIPWRQSDASADVES